MIASLRWPSAACSQNQVPRSSGPRQDIVSVIAPTAACSVRISCPKETHPVIPHMWHLPPCHQPRARRAPGRLRRATCCGHQYKSAVTGRLTSDRSRIMTIGALTENGRNWDDQAHNWIRWARQPGLDSYWRYRPELFEFVPPPGTATLDTGCGEGRLARDLAERGHRVTGIDASPTLVGAAR